MSAPAQHFYDALDEAWPGFMLDHLRAAVHSGLTNKQIIATLVFEERPPAEFFYYFGCVLDFIREEG